MAVPGLAYWPFASHYWDGNLRRAQTANEPNAAPQKKPQALWAWGQRSGLDEGKVSPLGDSVQA